LWGLWVVDENKSNKKSLLWNVAKVNPAEFLNPLDMQVRREKSQKIPKFWFLKLDE
jgi:hypothetical protein